MLRPLLFLSAFIVLADALQTISTSTVLDISSCPITYYGQEYEQLYVNFSSQLTTFCFDNFFNLQKKGDCIIGKSHEAQTADFEIVPADSFLERWIRNKTQSIQNSLKCSVQFKMQFNKSEVHLDLFNFRTEAVLSLESHIMGPVLYEVLVGGILVDRVYVLNLPDAYQIDDSLDISGCRYSGNMYKPGTVISSDPNTCSKLTCSETAVLLTSGCGPLGTCSGNSICTSGITCTVTGPTVIDIHGQVNVIKDRCAYSLLSTPVVPDFHVLANFQERRREDVSLLDSVTLRLDELGVYIHLEQGGRVRLNDSTLTLSSSAQLVHGVELSKDQTGVTAKLSLSNLFTSVFFDGYTAQIHLEGPAVRFLKGLCGNSSRSLSELRLSEYSSTSCEIQYNHTADSTINCNNVTERCNLLKEAPFTSCNNDVNPQPYITACTDTLCKYPAVDGLNCQFLKAYARACSLQGNHTLEGWTSKASCSPEAFCQDRTCSDHEFCGEKMVSGDTRCFCRAIFASKYRSTDSLGDPTVCRENSASLTLVGCLLEDKGIDYSALHLNDPTCRGQIDELTHMVTFSFNSSNSCGTVITANSSHNIYRNTIRTQNSASDIITRNDDVYIDFSCTHIQPNINTATFRIKDWSVAQQISSGAWNYTLTIKAYTDPGRTHAVEPNSELRLNQKIWMELETDGLDGDMVALVSDSCWATDQPLPSSSPRHDLIMNGCANPADLTVEVEENGLGTSTCFSFNMFRFTGGSGDIFMHCKLHLCPKQANSCIPTCNKTARRRRSASYTYEPEAPAFISMSWTN
ncbi:alpha-tectorin-like [Archocentrus centrarchus]|uniref:alpha-tectorin-like n=1 Tax=Archocentrus centrarchus TaxID=63155 RepID=UPI0011EA4788|nr:alpha-tectorin-like [Archocentrus centrarchus]